MGKFVDLTGMRFGRLTVIKRNEKNKGSYVLWICKCDCGNEVIVSGNRLKSGNTKSCGCYKKDNAIKDLNGMKFGKLTVIERCGSDKHGNALWLCQCECGNQKIVIGDSLSNGNTKSCGCYREEKTKELWKDNEFKQKQSNKMKRQWENEEFKQIQSNRAKKQMKEQWKDEKMKWKMHYKGGITPISMYLRSLPVVSQWFDDSKKQVNYTCELTGKVGVKLHTHHLYAFNMIVLEGHKLHNIEIKKQVKDYTKEELHKLEQYVESFHKDTSNAIVLCEQVHNLFHSLYGKGENTPEQFEEFKERYLNGEFDEILK